MRKIAAVLICFGAFGISVLAQAGRTSRPRVVAAPTPPTITKTDSPAQNSDKRPPVLKGGTGSTNQTKTSTNTTEAASEDDGEVIRVETRV